MNEAGSRVGRWLDAWLHSDLVGIPLTLAALIVVAASFPLYLLLGNVGGLVVGKLLFALALGGVIGMTFMLNGRRGESTAGMPRVRAGGPRRVLVVANDGLLAPVLSEQLLPAGGAAVAEQAMIVVPVVAASPLHALTDDIDAELELAHERLHDAVAALRRAGLRTSGHVDIGEPRQSLADGLREFEASEVLMLRGREHGWREAERFAARVECELGLPVVELSVPA
jgi:hypothetical protein